LIFRESLAHLTSRRPSPQAFPALSFNDPREDLRHLPAIAHSSPEQSKKMPESGQLAFLSLISQSTKMSCRLGTYHFAQVFRPLGTLLAHCVFVHVHEK
jgi:hypothetical protein